MKGHFVPADTASVSVEERGFRFGDGVFETPRIYKGIPLFFALHENRLRQGLEAIRIPSPRENLQETCRELLRRNATDEGVLRISISRGIGSRGYLPAVTDPPTVVIETLPLPPPVTRPLTLHVSRWRKSAVDTLPVRFKLAQGLNSILARMEAQEHQCDEALLLNAAGHICEAGSANIFWSRDGVLYTPDLACGLLDGITRRLLCNAWPQPVSEGFFTLDALKEADSVILTNSIAGAQAVASLTPQKFNWKSDILASQASALLNELRENDWRENRAEWSR